MASPVIEKLKTLSPPTWIREEPGESAAFEAIESEYGLKLPEDYKEFILFSNGGQIYAGGSVLHLEPADYLPEHNMNDEFEASLPGMFIIGDDAGGSYYFFDPKNQMGKGEYAIWLVSMGSLRSEDARFAGKNLTEVIEEVLAGQKFYDRPPFDKAL
jgi:hypothetical protein